MEADALAAMHTGDDKWRSYPGHEAHDPVPEVHRFFRSSSPRVLEIIGQVGGHGCEMDCWVNRYRSGGYIGRHSDRGPNETPPVATLNVCLAAPPPANGGELVLAVDGSEVRIQLQVGDALLFDGASIEHWTTPLVATTEEPEPFRMVAVGRYYVRG